MPLIATSVDEAVAAIPDGAMVIVPREASGVPMEATRALIRRGVKRLHLVALPTSTLQADMLIGAGCIETLETSAVSLGEFGPAPRFTAAILGKTIRMKDATCPAIYAAMQAAEKGVPFMPLRGLIGSDILAHRPDWRVIDNPFGNDDPIVLLPAIKPDFALFHTPMADRAGNVFIGRDREALTMAHASARTIATVEKLYDGNLMDDPALSSATVPGFYVETVAVAPRGAWPLRLLDHYPADGAHLAEYAKLAATADGFARYLRAACVREEGARDRLPPRRTARRRDHAADRRRAACRGRQCLADPGARGADAARARRREALRVAARQPPPHVLHRRRARAVRLRRPGPHRRVLPVGRRDRRRRQHQSGQHRRLRAAERALPRLVRLRLSLLRRAEGDPVPPRAFAPHAGAEGVVHFGARRQRCERAPHRRTGRAHHQPLPVLVRSRAQTLHACERASGAHGRGGDREHRLRFRPAGCMCR